MKLSEDELKKKLTPRQYQILREQGTEAPFSGDLLHNQDAGMYKCAACNADLFSSKTKFDSGTGWPSFYDVAKTGSVDIENDLSQGMHRLEVKCATCKSHLGHVFEDGPADKTGKRYCINSACLDFDPKK